MGRAAKLLALLLLAAVGPAQAEQSKPGQLRLEVAPREAAVGDPIHATLELMLPAGSHIEPPDLGESFGEFSVLSGTWQAPEPGTGGVRYRWSGNLAAYKVGSLTIPALTIQVPGPEGPASFASEPVAITIRSVLAAPKEGEKKEPELSDLKGAASIAPNFGPLRKALAALLALLLAAGAAWWIQRRYAGKIAAVSAPEDPFRRMAPHLWAYQQLQHLLERRLAEEGKVDLFFSELSTILKTYLGGRYRLDLLEHTTAEVVPLLRQAGAPSAAQLEIRALLERSDLVKFARQALPPEACRKAVEEAYGIVDATKPVEERAGAA